MFAYLTMPDNPLLSYNILQTWIDEIWMRRWIRHNFLFTLLLPSLE